MVLCYVAGYLWESYGIQRLSVCVCKGLAGEKKTKIWDQTGLGEV